MTSRATPPRRALALAALSVAALSVLLASPAAGLAAESPAAAPYVPGEVVVGHGQDALPHVVQVADGSSVRETISELRGDPGIEYAVPNYIARASAFPADAGVVPNDPGFELQWNFWGPFGVNMPEAWNLAARRGAPGGRGAVVAVLDTGVAYQTRGRLRRAPDLGTFVPGYDFVDEDRLPLDLNGHGTHVAGTIAESTNNARLATGVAYGAKIMPVRTLDMFGAGDAVTVSRGIRYAVRHHADVINMSLEFPPIVNAADVPQVVSALKSARRHRIVVTTVAGNGSRTELLPYPGRARDVIAVAATTERGCRAEYSNAGAEVDVAAPGGGPDAAPASDPWDAEHCRPGIEGKSIYQQTFGADSAHFALPSGFYGTSMASPHVAGLAALIIASKRLGGRPSPSAVQRLIQRTARDVGPPGFDTAYGYGLIDAAAALR
jgi:serine protease